jgi:hypothetical protein
VSQNYQPIDAICMETIPIYSDNPSKNPVGGDSGVDVNACVPK